MPKQFSIHGKNRKKNIIEKEMLFKLLKVNKKVLFIYIKKKQVLDYKLTFFSTLMLKKIVFAFKQIFFYLHLSFENQHKRG